MTLQAGSPRSRPLGFEKNCSSHSFSEDLNLRSEARSEKKNPGTDKSSRVQEIDRVRTNRSAPSQEFDRSTVRTMYSDYSTSRSALQSKVCKGSIRTGIRVCRAQSVVSGSTLRIGSRHFSQSVFLHVKWPARNLSNI